MRVARPHNRSCVVQVPSAGDTSAVDTLRPTPLPVETRTHLALDPQTLAVHGGRWFQSAGPDFEAQRDAGIKLLPAEQRLGKQVEGLPPPPNRSNATMPFLGVLPERRHLFQPHPRSDIGVNDAEAWRLNPGHRRVYDKLALALAQGLTAAPCGVSPLAMGLPPEQPVFVKPITNLAGMSLNARALPAAAVPAEPGSFWCTLVEGRQTSTDCLVRDGEVLWRAHTRAADERDHNRPIWWEIGVQHGADHAVIDAWVAANLAGYTGLCNLELIDDTVIEAHLRGSNGFFDFYGAAFFAAWVALVDHRDWRDPGPITGGALVSLFGHHPLPPDTGAIAQEFGVAITPDPHTADRVAVIRGPRLTPALAARQRLAVPATQPCPGQPKKCSSASRLNAKASST